jgi:signal peptidase I
MFEEWAKAPEGSGREGSDGSSGGGEEPFSEHSEYIEQLLAGVTSDMPANEDFAGTQAYINAEVSGLEEEESTAAPEAGEPSGADASDEASEEAGGKKKSAAGVRTEIYDWIQTLVSTLLAVIIAFIFLGRQITVIGDSMYETLHDDDKVLMTNIFYTPEYGDIVIIKAQSFGETPLVKRIIATEGQEIDIDFVSHTVTVDGAALSEPYIYELTSENGDFKGPLTVPEGCVFVMGDNRNHSTDSRFERVGFVDKRNILGKVHFITVPGKNDYGIRDWSRVGSAYKTTP